MNTLLLVGHGKMGGVMLERLRDTHLFTAIHIISPNHTQKDSGNLHWHRDLNTITSSPSVVLFAVKPAMLEALLPHYATHFANTPLYLSVAAGKTLSFYHQHLGAHAPIVRAMPNTPSLIGEGMTALCATDTLSATSRKIATDIMQALGETLWVDEAQMDAVTALSGCGPAYVFLFIESLINTGVAMGLTAAQAKTLALQTLHGAHALATQSSKSLSELCTQVASPGGATEAAIKQLQKDNGLQNLISQAMHAALARTKEMAS